uniref:F-box domain-containing protein n=2 Tax=Monopterus albus TaxID=43700 RepID=A0A3Q3IPV1_MONAL|nr:F-box only protein 47 isoform X2 [Monopterus albus]XP_020470071.1 F-box only protein 47 isoform X2 [Monopterus albus]XP_020470072.1 F-box only protein 47 isoform X2 [Monopterus albus]XP_020470073.1 F-box only protein 47 isoform X2 [Monopterus albus]XP_020470074.1 F-box only protein 47 isoform X2 [Monopterus albus]
MVNARKAPRNVGKYTPTHKRPHHPARTIVTRSQCVTSPSFFHRLPSEIFDMILDKLSLLEISVFSMVSKKINRHIVDYISTVAWKNKMVIQSFHHSNCLEQRSTTGHYRELGLLFKRCTLLLPTKERLKFMFSKFSQIPCFMLEQCLAPDCFGFSCYGVFLQTLIAGWDELECQRVFSFLCNITNLLQKMEIVITAKPGVRWYQELQLRVFCRQVLLDPWSNQLECQFWLTQLLRPWPMVSQAHLLFILYGPLMPEGTLGWRYVVERWLPHSALWDLARALLLLFGKLEAKGWTSDSILTILEELFVIPQPWHVENVARLLVLCGSSLCYTFLASKARNGRLFEISRLIVYIILVCEKDGYHMSWAVKLVQQICKSFTTVHEKFYFIQQLENTFSEITREFVEVSAAGNHLEDRETFQTLCILLDSSARFHTKFLQMFLK